MNRHCWKCGYEWTHTRIPGRSETCVRCQSDIRCCRNCISYDVKVAYHCRDRRADLVEDKIAATYCEYFEFAVRAYTPPDGPDPREAAARERLKKLLG